MRIILASKSPRRKELMDLLNVDYEIITSNADETHEEGLTIEEESKRLSYIKAKKVFDETTGDRIVIGSDTMVLMDGKIYEKPKDEQDAIRMLQELQGNKHEVITGLSTLIEENGNYKEYIDYDKTYVYIKPMTLEEIKDWVSSGESLDKAGGYAVQSKFFVYMDKIEGNYTTVVGMPMPKLYEQIKEYLFAKK